LGNGFQEIIYQRALEWELSNAMLSFAREIEQEIFYKNLSEPIGSRRADFVVEGKVLVELKAIIALDDVHTAQVLNYLKAYKLEVGLLINFGGKSLTFKRLVL
jgi:GxxExxY protein